MVGVAPLHKEVIQPVRGVEEELVYILEWWVCQRCVAVLWYLNALVRKHLFSFVEGSQYSKAASFGDGKN